MTFTLMKKDRERVFFGIANVAILDKQGDIISGPALREALPQLLLRARVSLNHQDICPAEILSEWTGGDGRVLKTEVRPMTEADLAEFPPAREAGVKEGDEALFMVGKMFEDDAPFNDMVWEKMQRGELNCLSISGQAIAHTPKMVCEDVCKAVKEISKIALSAVTLCKVGANPGAHLNIVSKSFTGALPQNFIIFRKAWYLPAGSEDLLHQMDARVRKGLDTDGSIALAAAHLRNYVDNFGFKYIDSNNTVHAESGKVLGRHDTHAEAVQQLRAVEANKHKDSLDPPGDDEGVPGLKLEGEQLGVGAEMPKDAAPGQVHAVAAKVMGAAHAKAPPPRIPRMPKAPTMGGYTPTQKAMDLALRGIESITQSHELDAMEFAKFRRANSILSSLEEGKGEKAVKARAAADKTHHAAAHSLPQTQVKRTFTDPQRGGATNVYSTTRDPTDIKALRNRGAKAAFGAASNGESGTKAAILSRARGNRKKTRKGSISSEETSAARDAADLLSGLEKANFTTATVSGMSHAKAPAMPHLEPPAKQSLGQRAGAAIGSVKEGAKGLIGSAIEALAPKDAPGPGQAKLAKPHSVDVGTGERTREVKTGYLQYPGKEKWQEYQAANKSLDSMEKKGEMPPVPPAPRFGGSKSESGPERKHVRVDWDTGVGQPREESGVKGVMQAKPGEYHHDPFVDDARIPTSEGTRRHSEGNKMGQKIYEGSGVKPPAKRTLDLHAGTHPSYNPFRDLQAANKDGYEGDDA